MFANKNYTFAGFPFPFQIRKIIIYNDLRIHHFFILTRQPVNMFKYKPWSTCEHISPAQANLTKQRQHEKSNYLLPGFNGKAGRERAGH